MLYCYVQQIIRNILHIFQILIKTGADLETLAGVPGRSLRRRQCFQPSEAGVNDFQRFERKITHFGDMFSGFTERNLLIRKLR